MSQKGDAENFNYEWDSLIPSPPLRIQLHNFSAIPPTSTHSRCNFGTDSFRRGAHDITGQMRIARRRAGNLVTEHLPDDQ